jgi:hypothetical protein
MRIWSDLSPPSSLQSGIALLFSRRAGFIRLIRFIR